MGYYNNKGHFFSDEESLEHRAKYGTADSVTNEKGTDNKKNNSSEYNHDYYMKNKDKWKKDSESVKKVSEFTGMKEESIKKTPNKHSYHFVSSSTIFVLHHLQYFPFSPLSKLLQTEH